MNKVKYVKTKNNRIIVFNECFFHSEFTRFEPVSAGFISFGIDSKTGNPTCSCYGESISLGLKSEEIDSDLAKRQILGISYFME